MGVEMGQTLRQEGRGDQPWCWRCARARGGGDGAGLQGRPLPTREPKCPRGVSSEEQTLEKARQLQGAGMVPKGPVPAPPQPPSCQSSPALASASSHP